MPECVDCGNSTTGVDDYEVVLCRQCRDDREGIRNRPDPMPLGVAKSNGDAADDLDDSR